MYSRFVADQGSRKNHLPIATLPILNGKIYAVWDPTLVAAGFRSKDLSFDPFMKSMVKPLFNSSAETYAMVMDPNIDLTHTFVSVIGPSLQGDHLRRLNDKALSLLEEHFNGLDKVTETSNLWLWTRGLMMSVTGQALFGEGNPFEKDAKLEESLW